MIQQQYFNSEFLQKASLKLAWLYPEYLNLYGDRGNVLTLKTRASWHGFKVTVERLSLGQAFSADAYDLLFIGGGQDAEQAEIYQDLLEHKAAGLKDYIEAGGVTLAICGGYQLLGQYYKTASGQLTPGLNILPLYTEAQPQRLIGDLKFVAANLPLSATDCELYGFENHSGLTYLNGVPAFGKVVVGYGNNGKDQSEGCHYKNCFGTYAHGSFLPKNPAFADYLLSLALNRKYKLADNLQLAPLNEPLLERLRSDLGDLVSAHK